MARQRPEGLLVGLLVTLLVALLATPAPAAPVAPALARGAAPVQAPAARAPGADQVSAPGPTSTATIGPEEGATDSPGTTATTRAGGTLAAIASSTPSVTPWGSPSGDRGQALPPGESSSPTIEPPSLSTAEIIGQSVEGRSLEAYRFGRGAFKIVLVGNIHGDSEANTHELAQQLVAHFQAHPDQVPEDVSLWIIPTMNPDGLATDHRWNAHDVDLNRNADTDLDGCAGNDWSPDTVGLEGTYPGAGGSYPFSEPEARAVRDFLADAWIAVFYHSAAEAIFADTCQRHVPSARLAQVLSEATGYPVPPDGWSGYRITGEFGDYLAGEGVAAVTVELTDHQDPEFERNLAGVIGLLVSAGEIVAAEATASGAELTWLEPGEGGNTGAWQFAANSFTHPLGLEVLGETAYLLDGGRVLLLGLDVPAEPRPILAPGDTVENVRVLEPLDLAADGHSLLVLDRAGDVYRYQPETGQWAVERYDRPSGATYDHYFVALAGGDEANFLLETTNEQVWHFADGQRGSALLKLPRSRDVDVAAAGRSVFVLTRALNGPAGTLLRYEDARQTGGFGPGLDLMHPRQVVAAGQGLYVLDRAGRRLLAMEANTGTLQEIYQFTDRRAVSAVWADADGRLILAGRDTLFFYGDPQRQATIEGQAATLAGPQPHDVTLLEAWRGLQMPIEGAHLTSRDFQLPGAPRHYRLGVHEGMDFYGHTVGVVVDRSTAVRAVADGVVIRALVDYRPLTPAQAEAWATQSRQLGYTPEDVLDGYRGMQVWIDHGGGLVSRYAHLGSIAAGIDTSTQVSKGQVIARVGNSGTPGSLDSQTYDVHLHLELWLNGHYLGQFLRPIEAREWLERILR